METEWSNIPMVRSINIKSRFQKKYFKEETVSLSHTVRVIGLFISTISSLKIITPSCSVDTMSVEIGDMYFHMREN